MYSALTLWGHRNHLIHVHVVYLDLYLSNLRRYAITGVPPSLKLTKSCTHLSWILYCADLKKKQNHNNGYSIQGQIFIILTFSNLLSYIFVSFDEAYPPVSVIEKFHCRYIILYLCTYIQMYMCVHVHVIRY